MCNLICEWLNLIEENDQKNFIEEEIKTFILKVFDAKKADSIFASQNYGTAPVWLESMISSPYWRSLIYELAETYKNCLVLDYAIQVYRNKKN